MAYGILNTRLIQSTDLLRLVRELWMDEVDAGVRGHSCMRRERTGDWRGIGIIAWLEEVEPETR